MPTCLEHPEESFSHKRFISKMFACLLKAVALLLKTSMKPQTKLQHKPLMEKQNFFMRLKLDTSASLMSSYTQIQILLFYIVEYNFR